MTYTFEQLKEDVKKEAEALRVNATKEEIDRLKIDKLDPSDMTSCIYGQMTGDCNSVRGVDLIKRCAIRYIKDGDLYYISREGFERIQKYVSNEQVENLFDDRRRQINCHYSAIEAYILLPDARNANLISYLRGETDTLDL